MSKLTSDEKLGAWILGCFGLLMLLCAGFCGLIIWAIIRIVLHFT